VPISAARVIDSGLHRAPFRVSPVTARFALWSRRTWKSDRGIPRSVGFDDVDMSIYQDVSKVGDNVTVGVRGFW